jgi:hypothetical protein
MGPEPEGTACQMDAQFERGAQRANYCIEENLQAKAAKISDAERESESKVQGVGLSERKYDGEDDIDFLFCLAQLFCMNSKLIRNACQIKLLKLTIALSLAPSPPSLAMEHNRIWKMKTKR